MTRHWTPRTKVEMAPGEDILVEDGLAIVSTEPYRPTDDAMDWSVDDVVRKLCEEPSLLPQTLNLAVLAKAFRERVITGPLLLCDIDARALREDFNIDNLGRRAPILRVIEELRLKSAQYYAKVQRLYPALCDIPRDQDGLTAASECKRKRLSDEGCREFDVGATVSPSAVARLTSAKENIRQV
jgi:hypothetical protein